MSIEPTSVSKPVLREVEPSSGVGLWRSKQESSSGGKDSPFGSIWEKTIQGAQRLLGRESANPAEQEEEKEQRQSQRSDSSNELMPSRTQSGTGGRLVSPALGRAAFAANSIDAFSGGSRVSRFVETADIEAPSPERLQDQDSNERSSRSDGMRDESRPASDDREKVSKDDKSGDDREAEDEDDAEALANSQAARNQARKESLSRVALSPRTNLAPIGQLPANGVSVATAETIPSAKSPPLEVAPISTNAPAAGAGPSGNPLGGPVDTTTASNGLAAQTNDQSVAALTHPTAAQHATTTAIQSANAQPADGRAAFRSITTDGMRPATAETGGEKARQAPIPTNLTNPHQTPLVAAQPPATKDGGLVGEAGSRDAASLSNLTIGESKSREALAEAMQRTGRVKSVATFQQPSTATPGAPVPASVSEAQVRSLAKEPTATPFEQAVESKDAPSLDGLKKDLPSQASRLPQASRTVGSEAGHSTRQSPSAQAEQHLAESSASQSKSAAGASPHAASPAREGRFDLPRPLAPTVANTNSGASSKAVSGGVAGVGGIQATATTGVGGTQSQSGQGDSGGAAKQDLGSAQQSSTPLSKSAEKPTGDPVNQTFDVKQATGETRRTQAASKAETTSYVSKSADEVKEIVATLSKSIDRLVTNRQGAMNLRINFEHGGTLSLKVSMEGGQVNTTMHTDVAGLESLIKSNWSELANDWSQKGVKLNTPQFHGGVAQNEGDLSQESAGEFASRQERQAGAQGAAGQGFGGRKGSREMPNGENGAAAQPNASEAEISTARADQVGDVSSDRELKTYA